MAPESIPPEYSPASRLVRVMLRALLWPAAWLAVAPGFVLPGVLVVAAAACLLGFAAAGHPRLRAPWLVPAAAGLELASAGLVVAMAGHPHSPWLLLFPWLLLDYRRHRIAGPVVLLGAVPVCLGALRLAGISWPEPAAAGLQVLVLLVTAIYALADRPAGPGADIQSHRTAPQASSSAWDGFKGELLSAFDSLARDRPQGVGFDRQASTAAGARALARVLRYLNGPGGRGPDSQITYHHFEPGRMVEAACIAWAASAGPRGVDLQGYVHFDALGGCFGDRERFADVLDLLLLAGCFSVREGLVLLRVDATGAPDSQEALMLELAVRGEPVPGFPAEDLQRVLARAAGALGGRLDGNGSPAGAPWRIRVPMDRQEGEHGADGSDALRGLPLYLTGASPLRPILASCLSEAGADLVDDPGRARLIMLAESARHAGTEDRCQALKRRHPRRPLLCLGATGLESSGVLLEADGVVPVPFTRAGLADLVLRHAGERQAGPPRPRPAPDADESRPVQADGQVLVAEDDAISARVVTRFLEGEGLAVTRVGDGLSALEVLRNGRPRLALLDMHMPGLDGVEVATRVRAWESESGRDPVPLVALTASSADADRRACRDAGMDDFLSKPVDREALREMLARLIPGK